jgi:hypothetical protein
MHPERIGKYRILGEIGRGTMGEVLKALDPALNREVALKTLAVPVGPADESLQRFQTEARAAALLNHPNIVTIHEFGREGSVLYMAMEFLQGTNLRDAIDNDLLKTLDEKLDIMDQVLEALDYAHARGVVHRDVKPANIHLGDLRTGPMGSVFKVKIMDFGLARMDKNEITQEGIVLGTPNYMSPEQALGDKVDQRSDLFSIGAVLYELLSGHKPFEADSTPSVLYQVVHKQPPPIHRWVPDVPPPLVAVVNRALDKNRDRRFQTAAEMRAALASARRGRVAAAPRPQPPPLPVSARPARNGRTAMPPPVVAPSAGSSPATGTGALAAPGRITRSALAPLLMLGVGLVAILFALITMAAWLRSRPSAPPPSRPTTDTAQVGALTHALVATQTQLAERELADKNYEAAARQAESALKHEPGHPQAERVLATARERMRELESTVMETRRLLETGDTAGASKQLSRVLELDPRQPAAAELSARLNRVFRTQAEAAAESMRAAHQEAVAAGASGDAPFASAEAQGREGQALFAKGEFADATRTFLEARDAFDRVRRAAAARAPQGPPTAPAPAATATPASAAATPLARPIPAPVRPTPTPAPAASAAAAAPTPEPTAAPPRFVAGATNIATRATGGIEGFDATDVHAREVPQFLGRMEFEVLPATVRPGEPFVVRIHLVNDGRRPVKVRAIALTSVVDGKRAPAPAHTLQREVAPQQRGLVAEYSAVWSASGSWSLETVVTVDRDETIANRLNWN